MSDDLRHIGRVLDEAHSPLMGEQTRLKEQYGSTRSDWATLMAKRRRKTLVVCMPCHQDIHTGKPFSIITGQSLESDVQ